MNKAALYYLKNHHSDLTHQLESGGIDKINFASEATPYFDEDSEAREYLINLAIVIDQMEATE